MRIACVKQEIQEIPHGNGTLNFAYSGFKGDYFELDKQIKEAGLGKFVPDKAISLVHDALKDPRGEVEKEILNYLNQDGFYESAGNLIVPKGAIGDLVGGVFIEYNPKIKNRKVVMDKSDLIKRLSNAKQVRSVLFSKDGLVRFVPFGFKIGEVDKLKGNDFILAKYGEEGEEKADEVARSYKSNPFVGSYNSVGEEILRVSGLFGYNGLRLYIDGYNYGVSDDYHAFGVKK